MSRLINKWNDGIRNQTISIIRNLTTENGLSFDELGVLNSFLLIERTENSKLAHYEDLEDEGRLIELPCAVGDTVYWISESDACLFCNGPCYERCEEGALKIKEIPFKPHMLNEIGEIIFLTKEEAEAKLKGMEGAE